MLDGEIIVVKFLEIMKVLRGYKLFLFVREYYFMVRIGLVFFFVF